MAQTRRRKTRSSARAAAAQQQQIEEQQEAAESQSQTDESQEDQSAGQSTEQESVVEEIPVDKATEDDIEDSSSNVNIENTDIIEDKTTQNEETQESIPTTEEINQEPTVEQDIQSNVENIEHDIPDSVNNESEDMNIESPEAETMKETSLNDEHISETAFIDENVETLNAMQNTSYIDRRTHEPPNLEENNSEEAQQVQNENFNREAETIRTDFEQQQSTNFTNTEALQNAEDQSGKESKSKKKKKRRRKKARAEQKTEVTSIDDDSGIEIEYVSEKIDLPKWDPSYAAFHQIFEAFKLEEKPVIKEEQKVEVKPVKEELAQQIDDDDDDDDDEPDKEKKEEPEKLSKKQLKKQSRMAIATLKQMVTRPDVVEMHDVNSKDPQLLVYLKAYKNTVPVPRHWCFKRKYLAGKRGFVKPPFELPDFIKQTGIMEMRAAMQEKEDSKSLKSKQRGKIRPKLGKIDIDYQKLHDAFFKFQTKPKMTIHGDLYYEGKEFEIRLKEKKPGDLSDDLRTALGMPVGAGKHLIPPPWLIAMQRYGPPPSYPNLKVPGLNAPIPEGASFGYHAGGWGKPPVDEMGKPLYGDVFGTSAEDAPTLVDEDTVDKTPWGELESESESEEESEEEEEDEDETGLVTPGDAGLVTPSGLSSVGAGLETPDMIELRKRKEIEDAMETGGDTPALYTVLSEKRTNVGAAMMGSQHTYDLAPTKKAADGVEITLDPSELELEPAAMAAKYDDTMKEREANINREDFSDMVAEHAAKKKRKKPTDSGRAAKKYKEFKF